MGLEHVKEEIVQEAQQRAKAIVQEAEARKDNLLSEAEQNAEEIVAKAEKEAEKEADALRRKKLSAARMQAKRKRLEAREDVLEQVYEQFRDRIQNLDEDKEEELIKNVLDRLDDQIDIGTVYAGKDHKTLAKKYGDFTEKDIRGVIVETADGSRRFDLQFDEVADGTIDDNRQAVSKVLFE